MTPPFSGRWIFDFICLPIPNGGTPTLVQTESFVRFVEEHRQRQRAVAVHCEAGLGRTGTMLAAYLIARGDSFEAALSRVRAVEPSAVESKEQFAFLQSIKQTARW